MLGLGGGGDGGFLRGSCRALVWHLVEALEIGFLLARTFLGMILL